MRYSDLSIQIWNNGWRRVIYVLVCWISSHGIQVPPLPVQSSETIFLGFLLPIMPILLTSCIPSWDLKKKKKWLYCCYLQDHGSSEPVCTETLQLLPLHLFDADYIIAMWILVSDDFFPRLFLAHEWWPQIQVLPRIGRLMGTILCFLVVLNLLFRIL